MTIAEKKKIARQLYEQQKVLLDPTISTNTKKTAEDKIIQIITHQNFSFDEIAEIDDMVQALLN